MKIRTLLFSTLVAVILLNPSATFAGNRDKGPSPKPKINFISHPKDKRVDVMIDGKLFTSYIWPVNVMKPVLYPVITASGKELTRGFPLNPRPGERVDHPHHIGIWFNYGDVNGFDFWNNSEAIPAEKKSGYGMIRHKSIDQTVDGKGEGSLITSASWIDPKGEQLLAEKTEFYFTAEGTTRIIDRITTLTTGDEAVSMKDNKEGMIAIRVARELELPSKDEVVLTDAKRIATKVKAMTNEGVTGSYLSSEGIRDDAVWGTRGKWMQLTGEMGGEKVAIIICDHPKNVGYPTFWHSRGYGLFAANPLGWSVFTNGKEQLNYNLGANQSVTFRYRIIVQSGEISDVATINRWAEEFGQKYD